ncbi:Gfo/Idh/MocA family protein [Lederbergia galactosidilytica]|uniref:Oxidoreductase n=1 Tax=Lederbergia galactosidilytica TaxID=217031 RepID=A0A177ZTL5_9BACI|nr:Gfo/Idh/MocA family oxidoreductase [Lederbergia galactosidilytica]KRG13201.1 oxidoreductase [Virgibacillus soli]OAK71257.1 oxidoreductase [Lederbergia galactosidilytica]
MTDQQKVRIGIIGCGGIANQKHLPSLVKLGDTVDLVAFCDVLTERAKKAASQYGSDEATVYTDYKQLLEDTSIDAVHVCTPNISHAEITIAALEAGKHVMCEKPMAINSKEAKEMIDTAKRTGKKLTIGYQNRFRKDSLALHKACEAEDLGEVYFAKAHAIRRRGVPTWGVFMDKEKQGGGPLIDIGTHALDLTLWMMNNYKPKLVVGSTYQKLTDKNEGNVFGPWNPEEFNVEDSAFGYIKMENGATIMLEASWALNLLHEKEAQVTLCGTEAGAEMFGNPDTNEGYVTFNTTKYGERIESSTTKAGGVAYFGGEEVDMGYLEAKQWIDAILHDAEPLVKPEEAYVVTQILEAIYESAETGKAIELN